MFDRTSFVYPCGGAGFDPSHPAAQSCKLSAVATAGNFVNLLKGVVGAIVAGTGAPVGALQSIGPCVKFPTSTGTGYINFAGNDAGNFQNLTIASIISLNTVAVTNGIFASSTTNLTGVNLRVTTGKIFRLGVSGGNNADATAPIFVTGVPYFVVASWNGASVNLVITKMDTGQIFKNVAALVSTPGAPNGTYVIGNITALNQQTVGQIAASMYSAAYLSMDSLVAWASDPWSFWYPRRTFYQVAPSAAGLLSFIINANTTSIGRTWRPLSY